MKCFDARFLQADVIPIEQGRLPRLVTGSGSRPMLAVKTGFGRGATNSNAVPRTFPASIASLAAFPPDNADFAAPLSLSRSEGGVHTSPILFAIGATIVYEQ